MLVPEVLSIPEDILARSSRRQIVETSRTSLLLQPNVEESGS